MRAFGIAFLPVTVALLLVLFHFGYGSEVYCGLYPLIIFGAVLFVVSLRNRRQNRQWTLGLLMCNACGYDLTGNVSSVCPECGEKT